ncbi:MAG: hypothetical protein GY701_13185 [Sulfitobacter sp.]|nr:hypothetical protein [Sulfitobacter sp.]
MWAELAADTAVHHRRRLGGVFILYGNRKPHRRPFQPTFRTKTAKFLYFANNMKTKHIMALVSKGSSLPIKRDNPRIE